MKETLHELQLMFNERKGTGLVLQEYQYEYPTFLACCIFEAFAIEIFVWVCHHTVMVIQNIGLIVAVGTRSTVNCGAVGLNIRHAP